MSRYMMSLQNARRLQKWTLEVSGANKFIKELPKLPKTRKINNGMYVSYDIDEDDLDDGIDWPTPVIATIYAVINNQLEELGGIMAYNFETYWLSTSKYEAVDNAKNWWEIINEDYKNLLKDEGVKR